MPVSFDYIYKEGKARVLVFNKDSNKKLLSEIKQEFKLDYKKFLLLLKRFNEHGEIKDEEKFKHISGKTYEFKVNALRVFCVMLNGPVPVTVVINHYYKKQKKKMPVKERTKALKLSEHIQNLYNDGTLTL